MGSCEELVEACSSLVVSSLAPQEFSVVIEKSDLEQDLERNFDDMGKGVGCVSGGGVVHRIFDLIDESFKSLIALVGIP